MLIERWFMMFCFCLVLCLVIDLSTRHSCNKCQFVWCPKFQLLLCALQGQCNFRCMCPLSVGIKWWFQVILFFNINSVKCDQNVLCLCFFDKFYSKSFVFQPTLQNVCASTFMLFIISQCSLGVFFFWWFQWLNFPPKTSVLQCVQLGDIRLCLCMCKYLNKSFLLDDLLFLQWNDHSAKMKNYKVRFGLPVFYVWKVYKSVAVSSLWWEHRPTSKIFLPSADSRM